MEETDIHYEFLPWVEKYRPSRLDDIKDQTIVINTIKKFILKKNINNFPHLLFAGSSGTGKTSTIMACIKEIYGEEYYKFMVIKVNASVDRGIEIIRNRIKEFIFNRTSIFLPVGQQDIFKTIIMDEADSMTPEAQGMLRSIIEGNSVSTRFVLLCNKIDKIGVALRSRCTNFRFFPLQKTMIKEKLEHICQTEKITVNREIIDSIANVSQGDLRKAINQLQSISSIISGKIDDDSLNSVYRILGLTHPKILALIYESLQMNIPTKKVYDKVWPYYQQQNITITNLLNDLSNIIIDDKKMNNDKKIKLIIDMAKIEKYESSNMKIERIFMYLIAIFNIVFYKP